MDTLFRMQDLRQDYKMGSLDIESTRPDAFVQFQQWFSQALLAKLPEPNAMALATVQASGAPSVRIVLLKNIVATPAATEAPAGFVFYTNYDSHKGQQLTENPVAALCFHWHELERQVRIEGTVVRTDPAADTVYFQSRPKMSQLGASASPQSQTVESRAWLDAQFLALEQQYATVDILPKPENWGGFKLIPNRIEFWQGRSSRLHDRILYTLQLDGNWNRTRLAP